MPVEIKVPSPGESVSEGVLARWLKNDGDWVRRDESIAEIESDKAMTEVSAPASGNLKTSVPDGQKVLVGSVIGRIDEAPEPAGLAKKEPAKAAAVAEKPPSGPAKESLQKPTPFPMSPSAKLRVESMGIDPAKLTGSGRGGRIIKQDVDEHSTNGDAVHAVPSADREVRQRMSPIRARIAQRLLESKQSTAALTTFNEVDLTAVNELRAKFKDKFKEKHGVGLGYMSFFVKAAVEALKAYPVVNARIDGPDVVMQNFYDIGVAVSTDKGLMVPVLRNADQLSAAGIEKSIIDLATRARDGKVGVADLQGGTFTITNGGIFGSMLSTPILNTPQTAILGMHAIQKRPMVVNDQIVIRPMMYLALTYDHRLIDGREAVLFLVKIKECLEEPARMVVGV